MEKFSLLPQRVGMRKPEALNSSRARSALKALWATLATAVVSSQRARTAPASGISQDRFPSQRGGRCKGTRGKRRFPSKGGRSRRGTANHLGNQP